MTLNGSIKAAPAAIAQALRRFGCMYALGGPVGVFYTLRLAYLQRRIDRVGVYLCRERELHKEHLAILNRSLTGLIAEKQGTSVAAGQFWNWCEKKASAK